MNNKKLGTEFEREVCELLANNGYWVHFLAPDNRGAQPFDIIAVKDGLAMAVECKTLSDSQKYFSIDRLEDNQIFAFERWLKCGNIMPFIFIKHGAKTFVIPWERLKTERSIKLENEETIK